MPIGFIFIFQSKMFDVEVNYDDLNEAGDAFEDADEQLIEDPELNGSETGKSFNFKTFLILLVFRRGLETS